MTNPESLLKELGLTEYEAKAYLVLAARGELTAERVSTLAKIPLPRVYDTMTSLAEKGIVIVTKTRPQRFSPIEPEKILKLIKEDEQRKLNEKLKKMDEIMPQILSSIQKFERKDFEEEPDTLSYVKRRVSVETMWNQIHKKAKNSVIMFAGDLYWIDDTRVLMKRTINKGINYKIIWSKNYKSVMPRVRRLIKMGVQLKYNNNVGTLRGAVVDGHWTVLFQRDEQSDDELIRKKNIAKDDFTTLIISNRLISSILTKYFDLLWKNGITPDKYAKKFG